MHVVFDTNVYISAFVIPGSLSDDAYGRARLGDIDLHTSVAILTELASKLRDKFDWNEDRIRAALKSISRTAHVVKTTPHLSIVSDATDNRILECAEKVDADLIVTGDPHLLKLARFGRAGIVRVSAFLRILGSRSTGRGVNANFRAELGLAESRVASEVASFRESGVRWRRCELIPRRRPPSRGALRWTSFA